MAQEEAATGAGRVVVAQAAGAAKVLMWCTALCCNDSWPISGSKSCLGFQLSLPALRLHSWVF